MLSADIHTCNCTCDTCMDEDCFAIIQAHPKSTWTRQKLEWIRSVRSKPLNWTLEPGHCALCGGNSLSAWDMGEHWILKGHNPQTVGEMTYLSVLIADQGSWAATYREFTKKGKEALRTWTSHLLGVSPSFATAVAVRKVQDWTEIRVGFKYGS
jgi:hypothetical protein